MAQAFVELLKLLGSEDQPLVTSRLAELSDLDVARLERFSAAWASFSADRRHSILKQLGQMADSQIELSFEAINRMALDDPDPRSRAQAIANLWESEDPRLARPLLGLLEADPEIGVRVAAARALGLFVLLGETEDLSADLLLDIEAGLLRAVREDKSPEVRDGCLESLGFSSREEVPALIEQAYSSSLESTLRSALQAMARSANSRWEPQVMAKLYDPAPDIRLEAVQAAGELGLRQAAPDLVDLLDDVDDRVLRAAIRSLGQVGGPLASEALAKLQNSVTGEEVELVQDALDNLAFEDGARDLFTFDLDDAEDPAN